MAPILILGRTGQLARAFASTAGSGSDEIVCAGRAEADLARRGEVGALIRHLCPRLVINTAAFTDVDGAEAQSDVALEVNAHGAEEAAAASRRVGARYILVSTDYVFGGDGPAGPFTETAEPSPVNVYGATKLEGERLTIQADPTALIVRTSAVFSGSRRDFPSAVWSGAQSKNLLHVVDDQLTAPMFAGDLARRLLQLGTLTPAEEATGIFHAVGAPFASWADVAEAALAASRAAGGPNARVERIATRDFPRPAPRPKDSRLGGTRLEEISGSPRPDWRNRLTDAYAVWLSSRP